MNTRLASLFSNEESNDTSQYLLDKVEDYQLNIAPFNSTFVINSVDV